MAALDEKVDERGAKFTRCHSSRRRFKAERERPYRSGMMACSTTGCSLCARVLRCVHRGIGVLKQTIGVGPVARIDRDADTGRNAQLRNVRDDERFRERRQHFFRHALGVGFAGRRNRRAARTTACARAAVCRIRSPVW
ncbi:MAG: hypothetical protein ABSB70_19125 [Candidatus Velthaea sp.]